MGDEVAGLIGHGQVGSSIAECYKRRGVPLRINDEPKGMEESLEGCTIIHISIPPEVIANNLVVPKEPLYLIHSTVPVGFCRKFAEQGHRVLHCPVEGRHPDISNALEEWSMPLGGPEEFKEQALLHLITIGIVPDLKFGEWEETELAKLFSTTWMGVEVAIMRQAYELAARFGVDGDRVYKVYTEHYNHLYSKGGMGADEFKPKRPILTPMEGPIGGHCVGPNAEILDDCVPSWMTELVRKIAKEDWKNPCA